MANQTQSRRDGWHEDKRPAFPAASLKFYRLAAVAFDGTTGLLVKAGNGLPANSSLAGVVSSERDLTSTIAGSEKVEVIREGAVEFNHSGLTQATVGKDVYLSDDNTVTTTSTGNIKAGRLIAVTGTKAVVQLAAKVGA